jgi:hypothetical protein
MGCVKCGSERSTIIKVGDPPEQDPITVMLILIFNAIVLGMAIKWLIPEMKKTVMEMK